MRLRSIRPVGNRIVLDGNQHGRAIEDLAEGYRVLHLNSGTAALALAMRMACNRAAVNDPEVILPAYGCPDLVAAAVFAGVRPVLADLSRESVEYDVGAVSGLLTPSTVAIVAATFLGMRADCNKLRAIVGNRNIVVIEDSAQWFPRMNDQRFFGDLVVLSFGRGKPVNVLGGGALLVSGGMDIPSVPPPHVGGGAVLDAARVGVYNQLIRPLFYGIAENLPYLNIGLTRYHELGEISGMPVTHIRRLPANVRRYLSRKLDVQDKWREALARFAGPAMTDLARAHGVPFDYALLRYPILLGSRVLRDRIHTQSRRAGLGSSIMYGQALPDMGEVRARISVPMQVPNARDFAARLLTLPTHEDVDDATISRTVGLLEQ